MLPEKKGMMECYPHLSVNSLRKIGRILLPDLKKKQCSFVILSDDAIDAAAPEGRPDGGSKY
jgi:hypothetical protein